MNLLNTLGLIDHVGNWYIFHSAVASRLLYIDFLSLSEKRIKIILHFGGFFIYQLATPDFFGNSCGGKSFASNISKGWIFCLLVHTTICYDFSLVGNHENLRIFSMCKARRKLSDQRSGLQLRVIFAGCEHWPPVGEFFIYMEHLINKNEKN